MVVHQSTEAITFTFSISESVLNSSDSSSASSGDSEKSDCNSSRVVTATPCQRQVVNPPGLKRTPMPRIVSAGKAGSCLKNPYIDDDDSLDQEIARMGSDWDVDDDALQTNSRRVSAGEDLGSAFANARYGRGVLDGNTGVLDGNSDLLDRYSGVNNVLSSQISRDRTSRPPQTMLFLLQPLVKGLHWA